MQKIYISFEFQIAFGHESVVAVWIKIGVFVVGLDLLEIYNNNNKKESCRMRLRVSGINHSTAHQSVDNLTLGGDINNNSNNKQCDYATNAEIEKKREMRVKKKTNKQKHAAKQYENTTKCILLTFANEGKTIRQHIN